MKLAMLSPDHAFPADMEAAFRAQRCEALALINAVSAWRVAVGLLLFAIWDAYFDPDRWLLALEWRVLGALCLLALARLQKRHVSPALAPHVAKVGFAIAVTAVALALGELSGGFLFGLAGLGAVLCAGACVAIDRRDYLWLNLLPVLVVVGLLLHLDMARFVFLNALCALVMCLFVGALLTRVFEASNRRAFLLEQALSLEARTDALTGIANRRSLEEQGEHAYKAAVRSGQPLSVIVLDVDHFKRINDTHGHPVGDALIRAIAADLKDTVRDSDVLGRWGGEEFLVLLPFTGNEEAVVLAERLRARLAMTRLAEVPALRSTVSLGIACQQGEGAQSNWSALVKRADAALYRAKAAGRNCAVMDAHLPANAHPLRETV